MTYQHSIPRLCELLLGVYLVQSVITITGRSPTGLTKVRDQHGTLQVFVLERFLEYLVYS